VLIAVAKREAYVPTYQYACTDCGDRTEVVQKFTDDALTVCTTCGGKLRKVYSPVGIVFKGSGFYRTDSRGSSAAAAGANGSSAKDTAAKDGAKDGSAAAAKSDSSSSATSSSDSSSSSSSEKSSSSGKPSSSEKKSTAGAGSPKVA
jgi:putative FmdB family regulatory protein